MTGAVNVQGAAYNFLTGTKWVFTPRKGMGMATRTACGGAMNPGLPEKQNRRHHDSGIMSCQTQYRQCFAV